MLPRTSLAFLILAFATMLPGCPETPEDAPPMAPPTNAGPPQPAEGGGMPAQTEGGAPPEGGPPPAGGPGETTMIGASPEGGAMINLADLKFSRVIAPGEKTVSLTVHVEGGAAGRIDIVSLVQQDGNTVPSVLHTEAFTGTKPLVITAPATYAESLYLSAMVRVDKAGKDAPPPSGPIKVDPKQVGGLEPVKLEGKDLDLTIKMGTVPKWLEKLSDQATMPAPPPDGAVPAGPPPPAGAAPPPGGAPPPADAGGAPPAAPAPAPK